MAERPRLIPTGPPLGPDFFARDTLSVARDLVGALLVSRAGGEECGGVIVETEAYLGAHDPGSHAATKGVTARNRIMYGPPGRAYVYFTYGAHHMLNVVTEPEGVAGAVLLRAIEPLWGTEVMRRRRAATRRSPRPLSGRELASGPGRLAAALGIDLSDNGGALDGSATLALYDAGPPDGRIAASGRIGLREGHELDYRFFFEGNPFVSAARPGPLPARRRADS